MSFMRLSYMSTLLIEWCKKEQADKARREQQRAQAPTPAQPEEADAEEEAQDAEQAAQRVRLVDWSWCSAYTGVVRTIALFFLHNFSVFIFAFCVSLAYWK